jgi:adenylate kinase family enzyme
MLRTARALLSQRASTDERLATASVKPATRKHILQHQDRSDREQPVVILGRIGHGKSTFLKYLRHVEAKDILSTKYIQIDLNFLRTPSTATEVPTFVMRQVQEQLKSYNIAYADDVFVRRVLKTELEEFRKTPRGVLVKDRPAELQQAEVAYLETITNDADRYMASVMKFIRRSHQKSVAIFFDNLDRRSDDIQEQAFLRAAAMANDWGVLVFVCLRPGSVQRSSASGILDTMAPRMLVIPQPDIPIVLRKRFQYASRYAARDLPEEAYAHVSFPEEIKHQLPEASRFFTMCDQSTHRNPALARQFEAISNGNIRKIMEYVRKVITSRHLDTHKIISILNSEGEYRLAAHETLRAIIFGPYIHFDPKESPFTNVFDIASADPAEHFSRTFLLDYCQRYANSVTNSGFIQVVTLQEYMASLGYSGQHIAETLSLLLKRNCLEGHDESQDQEKELPTLRSEIRITSLGSFHITTLVRTFLYIDAIAVDTPILEDNTRVTVCDVEKIGPRLKRARILLGYFQRQAEHFTDVDARRVLDGVFSAIANDITDIEQGL